MAVNHYFQGGKGIGNQAEKRLHEDIIIESLKIFGQDIYYLPRTLVNRDLVLGEDTSSRFDDSYLLEMYLGRLLPSNFYICNPLPQSLSLAFPTDFSFITFIIADL